MAIDPVRSMTLRERAMPTPRFASLVPGTQAVLGP